jgi:AcrR family transcriptional regulator
MTTSISLGFAHTDHDPRPERRDAAANRQLLLETAAELFADQGVASVHMTDIAKEAGVGKGTLYRRFAHKGELCLHLLDKELQAFQEGALASLREQTAAGRPFMAQLDSFLDSLVPFIASNLPLMIEIANSPLSATDSFGLDVNRPHFWQEMTVRGLLQRAQKAAEIPPHLDVPYIASALMAPLDARILHYQLEVQAFPVSQISAGLRQLVNALAHP